MKVTTESLCHLHSNTDRATHIDMYIYIYAFIYLLFNVCRIVDLPLNNCACLLSRVARIFFLNSIMLAASHSTGILLHNIFTRLINM